jgi:hypothetical protein
MTTAFVGDMALRFQEMLLQFLLGVPAPPRGIPHFPGGLGAPGLTVAGPAPA